MSVIAHHAELGLVMWSAMHAKELKSSCHKVCVFGA